MIQIGQRYTRGKNGPVTWTVSDYDPSTDMLTLSSDRGKSEVKPYSQWADMIISGKLRSTL